MALAVIGDIAVRLSQQAYTRLFAKSGGGVADLAFAQLCLDEASSVVRMTTAAAFPAGFDAAGGTVDPAIVGATVDIALEIAASRHGSAAEMQSYLFAGKRARDFLRALTRDADARPVTSAAGRAQPEAVLAESTDDAGNSTRVYGDLADRQGGSSF